jgi:eukaryotic-like serine/threonine-protein kinase
VGSRDIKPGTGESAATGDGPTVIDHTTPAPGAMMPSSGSTKRRSGAVGNPIGGVGNPVNASEDSRTLVHADPNRRTDPALHLPGPLNPLPQQIIAGRYELISPIGEGSMGRIFLAEQISVGRRVALKIINRELGAKYDTIARFQQEARLLASVKNEHIIDIYDIGETENGDPFIAMEYVDGMSLAHALRENGALDPARVIRLSLQIASALATVHEAGVVHRDLKPANIMLLRVGANAELVKILDFGLAKVLSDREASGRLTRTGSIVGTPEYMSPEQVSGNGVDHRADIYGFGCTAYEMACGHPPFTGAEVSTLYKHLHEPVPPLTERRPTVPLPLAAVIHRCLEKHPDARYQTAHELYEALLDAADRAAIPRLELRVPRSGIDYMPELSRAAATVQLQTTRYRGQEVALIAATMLVLGLLGGVLVDRAVGRGGEAAARPPAAVAGVAVAPAAAGKGILLVTTVPPGVEVSVDGATAGKSPLVARELAPGKHRVAVRGRGWEARDQEVDVGAGQLAELNVKLERPRYSMHIESVPAGATVTIDGKPVGETPLDAPVTELEFHQLSFSHDGYRTREMYLAPDSHETKLRAVLYPVLLHAGSIIVNSEYAGRVIIDGQDTGEWTPTGEIQLSPGRHTIELVDAENIRRKSAVTIVEGQLFNLDVPAPKTAP